MMVAGTTNQQLWPDVGWVIDDGVSIPCSTGVQKGKMQGAVPLMSLYCSG